MAPDRSSDLAEYAALAQAARARFLRILGGFHPDDEDAAPPGCRTLLLIGPDEPAFWSQLQAQPEWSAPDPVDCWSERVIGSWADAIGAEPLFPFHGPPYHPFFRWAERTGRIHASPIRLLVHDAVGLMVSFRGALALPDRIALPPPPPSPCLGCPEQPCRTACPVDAFSGFAYDVGGCKAFLDTDPGRDCLDRGCRARRTCPVSEISGRQEQQSAYHMRRFKEA